jgi:uncharacterized protein YxeA
MKKIISGIVILIILILILILIIIEVRTPFGKNNSSFASEPKDDITRVEFSQDNKKLTLEKKGDVWFVNGKSEARKSGVLFILRVLKEIKIKSPVSPELFRNEITAKNIMPVKVRVYEKNKNLKTFLVYKTASNTYGNMMKIRDGSKPFIVYVPGYEGDIGSGFTLNELFWQPYTVFNLLPSEIASVQLENLSDTSSSFSIIDRNHHYFLSRDAANRTGWDSSLVVRYISYFAWVPFESWDLNSGESDQKSIESQPPLYRFTVLTTKGKKTILTLWAMKTLKDGKPETDSDRLLGKTDDRNGLFIMRYFDIDPLIKKRSYFYRK